MEPSESGAGQEAAAGSSGLPGREEGARTPPRRAQQRGNRLAPHPTLSGMMSLNVADSSSVYAAFLVYLDLLEARNWHEVSYTGLAEFQLVYLHGREREVDDLQVVVPTPVHVSFSHERGPVRLAGGGIRLYQGRATILSIFSAEMFVSTTSFDFKQQVKKVLFGQRGSQQLEMQSTSCHCLVQLKNGTITIMTVSLQQIRQIMKRVHTVEEKPDYPLSIMLAIVESDSTIVYYKLTDGFVTPDPPDDTEDMDNKQWRKKRKRFLRQ